LKAFLFREIWRNKQMKQLFKKTILAATVAAVSGVAVAGDISVATTQNHSQQGLSGVTSAITSSNVTYTVQGAYAQSDLITITLTSGAVHSSQSWPNALTFTPAGTPGTSTAGANMSVGLLNTSSDKTSATYRVTSVTPDGANATGTTVGGMLNLGTFALKASAIASGAVTVSVASLASNGVTPVDTQGTRTGTLAKSSDQFGDLSVTTDADQVIDVSKGREGFETGTNDTITWGGSNNTGLLNAAAVSQTRIILNGDFEGMTTGNFSVGGAGSIAINHDAKTVTVTYNTAVTTDTITITPTTANTTGADVLKAQSFSVDGTYIYGTNKPEILAVGEAAGAWTLNGAVTNIPYMPYSPNASQILYVTNEGNQSGDIMVTAFDDSGTQYNLGTVGTIGPKSVKKITGEVYDALIARGFSGSGKLSLTVTVNAPADDVTVYAAYNVGGADRGYVNTDQYKGK
jgi:hypothetical protein